MPAKKQQTQVVDESLVATNPDAPLPSTVAPVINASAPLPTDEYTFPHLTTEDKCLVYNLSPGEVRREFMGSIINSLGYDRAHLNILQGPYLSWAGGVMGIYRNEAVEQFLYTTEHPWMLFVDSDIVFEPQAIYQLINTAKANKSLLASGVYVLPQYGGLNLSIYHLARHEEDGLMHMDALKADQFPQTPTYIADGCGAGFLLMHRDLLKRFMSFYALGHCWFGEQLIDGVTHGEDLSFCRRAGAIGHRILFDTTVRLGHVKVHVMYP